MPDLHNVFLPQKQKDIYRSQCSSLIPNKQLEINTDQWTKVYTKKYQDWVVVAQAFNPSTQEAEADDL